MASTRDKNSMGNYLLEQRALNRTFENICDFNGRNGHANIPAFPELSRPSYMPPDNVCKNFVDVESQLLGINSNNLVNPNKQPVKPEIKNLPLISFFDREKVIMPDDLKVDNNRPFIMN
jgi:hypothetical protein